MTTTAHARPLWSVPVTPTRGAGDQGGVELRPLAPGDAAAVLGVFDGMGARSRELRFLTHKPRLTGAELRRLAAVDDRDHVAFLASAVPDHRPVGIARFVRSAEAGESADVAVAVVDAWQKRGVGTMLLAALVRRAREVGVRRFTMLASYDNVAVLRLVHRAPGGLSRVHFDRGVAQFDVSLEG